MARMTMFEVLDPTPELTGLDAVVAPRLASLEGARIALLSNTKIGTVPLFDQIEKILINEHGVAEVARRAKGNLSAPCEPDIMEELLAYDAIFSATGD